MHDFSVLSLRGLSFAGADYVSDEIETLVEHYGGENAVIDKEQTMVEWSHLKNLVKTQQYPIGDLSIWNIIQKHHAYEFSNLLVLAEICLLLPLQTADVECGFSDQNLTNMTLRNRLGEESLDHLMTIYN